MWFDISGALLCRLRCKSITCKLNIIKNTKVLKRIMHSHKTKKMDFRRVFLYDVQGCQEHDAIDLGALLEFENGIRERKCSVSNTRYLHIQYVQSLCVLIILSFFVCVRCVESLSPSCGPVEWKGRTSRSIWLLFGLFFFGGGWGQGPKQLRQSVG